MTKLFVAHLISHETHIAGPGFVEIGSTETAAVEKLRKAWGDDNDPETAAEWQAILDGNGDYRLFVVPVELD